MRKNYLLRGWTSFLSIIAWHARGDYIARGVVSSFCEWNDMVGGQLVGLDSAIDAAATVRSFDGHPLLSGEVIDGTVLLAGMAALIVGADFVRIGLLPVAAIFFAALLILKILKPEIFSLLLSICLSPFAKVLQAFSFVGFIVSADKFVCAVLAACCRPVARAHVELVKFLEFEAERASFHKPILSFGVLVNG